MRTLDLAEAAAFLGLHPHTLQARAKAGTVPGAKVGKEWRFLDLDLAEYLRAQYPANKPPERAACSTSAAKRGTSTFSTKAAAFEKALGLPTRRPPSATTTSAAPNYGPRLALAPRAPG